MELQKLNDYKGLSITDNINNGKAIATLRKEGKEIEINLLAFVIEFCSIYKIDEQKNLSDDEIKQVVQILFKDYYFLKYNDFLLFLKYAKMGRYGKIYGSLDMPTLFQMLETYCDERAKTSESVNRVKSEEMKREPMSEETLKMIADLKEKLKPKRVFTDEVKPMDDRQKIINEWMADFKILTGEVTYKGFVEIDGVIMGINEYLNYRNEKAHENIS